MRKLRELLLSPCKACHKKGFGFNYLSLGQYDRDIFFSFFILSAPLSVMEKLKPQHADNMLTLYYDSGKKSIQADLQEKKKVDIFSIFCYTARSFKLFSELFAGHCKSLWT